jgi:hypothetical protein
MLNLAICPFNQHSGFYFLNGRVTNGFFVRLIQKPVVFVMRSEKLIISRFSLPADIVVSGRVICSAIGMRRFADYQGFGLVIVGV